MNKLWLLFYEDALEQAKSTTWSLQQVNQQDRQGRTLLMHAVILNKVDWVTYLLEQGADEDIKDNENYKAITLAAKHGYDKIMIHFLKTGAGG